MSKKKERISYLVGVYNVVNSAEANTSESTLTYQTKDIKAVLKTLQYLLKQDGIVGIDANSKAGE